MSGSSDSSASNSDVMPHDPISLVEEYMIHQNWNAERTSEHEIWAEIPGQWGHYRLWGAYHEDTEFLQFNCYLSIKIPDRLVSQTADTVCLMNERVWLGHFEIWTEEMVPVFRVVLPLRGTAIVPEQIEDIFSSMIQESERFFPAFQWVIWGGKSPAEAVAAAMVETEGEA